jgi:ABC-type multidrug transport system permease subunit
MRYVAYLTPLFHANIALREVMIKGGGLHDISSSLIILAVYAVITLILGVLVSKKRIE